jgi:threonine/homoserine/homoserine lactone efflux protein
LGLAIAAPLGPVNVEIIRRGLRDGFLPALMVGCGSTAADLIYVALAFLGVAPLAQHPMFRVPLNFAGAAVLGWLAWESFREARGRNPLAEAKEGRASDSRRGALAAGFLITVSNPMTIVFYFSLFGAAIAKLHGAPKVAQLAYVGCVVLGCLIWSLLLALALGWGKSRVGAHRLPMIGVASSLALAFFAARFLLEGIREVGTLLG